MTFIDSNKAKRKLILDIILLNTSFLISIFISQPVEKIVERKYMFFLLVIINIVWIVCNFYYKNYILSIDRTKYQLITGLLKSIFFQLFSVVFFLFWVKEDFFTRYFVSFYITLLIISNFVSYFIFLKYYQIIGKSIFDKFE